MGVVIWQIASQSCNSSLVRLTGRPGDAEGFTRHLGPAEGMALGLEPGKTPAAEGAPRNRRRILSSPAKNMERHAGHSGLLFEA